MAATNDDLIINTAAETGGVCLRQTLLSRGVTPRVIARRLSTGQLVRVRPGLYVVPHLRSRNTPLWQAQLAVPGAVLSRQSAARLHRMPIGGDQRNDRLHVTAAIHAGRQVDGVVVHESRRLSEDDIVTIDGLRVTSPARTLVDLGAELRPARLRNVMQAQFAAESPSSAEFLACFSALRRRGLDGVTNVAAALDSLVGTATVGVSELESRVWRGLNQAGIDGFTAQYVPPWFDGVSGVVDFAHVASRTILECDGRRWHQSQAAMLDDRRRDRTAAANGYLVLRVMWEEIEHRPTSTFAEIAQTLKQRERGAAA